MCWCGSDECVIIIDELLKGDTMLFSDEATRKAFIRKDVHETQNYFSQDFSRSAASVSELYKAPTFEEYEQARKINEKMRERWARQQRETRRLEDVIRQSKSPAYLTGDFLDEKIEELKPKKTTLSPKAQMMLKERRLETERLSREQHRRIMEATYPVPTDDVKPAISGLDVDWFGDPVQNYQGRVAVKGVEL